MDIFVIQEIEGLDPDRMQSFGCLEVYQGTYVEANANVKANANVEANADVEASRAKAADRPIEMIASS